MAGFFDSGLGIFVHYCWVNRYPRTVTARFSTYPTALPTDLGAETMRGFTAVAAQGLLRPQLLALPASSLAEIGAWVDGPLACYTVGSVDGEWFVGFDRLRDAGLGMLVVIALVRGSEQLGFFVVADRRASTPST